MRFWKMILRAGTGLLIFACLYEWAEHALPKRRRYTIQKQQTALTLLVFSDLHCSRFLLNSKRFLKRILAEKADAVCIAGDLVNKYGGRRNFSVLPFLRRLVKAAPVYYSLGNHESEWRERAPEEFAEYEKKVAALGVHFLDNTSVLLKKNGKRIRITGFTLPKEAYQKRKRAYLPKKALKTLSKELFPADYGILLAHTPDYAKAYAALPVNLICSGHLHGGLIRLPFVGGLISPQFTKPSYTKGVYPLDGAVLLVSAGLGSHTLFFRVFNRVEYILAELKDN